MVDEYTDGQRQVLLALRHAPLGEGERDEGFHHCIYEIIADERAHNIIKTYIPNLNTFLKVEREALLKLPNCGKKTADRIITIQEKLLKHRLLLPRLRKGIKAYNIWSKYREEHSAIIGNYHNMRINYNTLNRHFLSTWKFYGASYGE